MITIRCVDTENDENIDIEFTSKELITILQSNIYDKLFEKLKSDDRLSSIQILEIF